MYSALGEDFALLDILAEDCIEAEALGPCLEAQEHMLLVRGCDNVFICSTLLMGHHWSHSHGNSNSFATSSCRHHVSPIEAIHFRRVRLLHLLLCLLLRLLAPRQIRTSALRFRSNFKIVNI
jgi:hypothetical protein